MDDVTTLTSDKVDSCFLYNIFKKKYYVTQPSSKNKDLLQWHFVYNTTSADVCLQMKNTKVEKSRESK